MKNVISFPENKMKKAKKLQKTETRNAILSLSIVSLMLGALMFNESISRSVRPIYLISDNGTSLESLNRAIASAQPLNPFRDIEWEKSIAQKLGQDATLDERNPASVGKTVSRIDQLRFGPLAGKYHMVDQSGAAIEKIREIEYVESAEANDRPVFLDPDQFLSSYKSLLSIPFETFDKANPAQTNVREYRLMNDKKTVVGTAAFTMDDDGRFISLKVREAAVSNQ